MALTALTWTGNIQVKRKECLVLCFGNLLFVALGGRPEPGYEEPGLPFDKENFAALLLELRQEFDPLGLLLTAAVSRDQVLLCNRWHQN
jgi:hypothetical protein